MRSRLLAALASGLLMTGCNLMAPDGDATHVGANGVEPTSEVGNRLGARTPPPGPAGGEARLTRDYLVGRWTRSRNCTTPEFHFRADGTASSTEGGGDVRWRVEGSNIVVTDQDGSDTQTTPVQVTDRNRMVVMSRREGPVLLTRC